MIEEIIVKNVTQPKLTLTPSRMTIKFPETFGDRDRIIKFAKQIEEKLQGEVKFSLRGCFSIPPDKDFYVICLSTKGKVNGSPFFSRTFREGEI